MPTLSVLMVRAALVYLVAGFALGAVLLTHKAVPHAPALLVRLRPLHIELLTLGWTMNLGLGVAYWILPKHAGGEARGSRTAAVVSAAALNIGVLSVGFGQALGAPAVVALLGRVAEVAAAGAFALHAWRRVKPYGAGRPTRGAE